MCVYNLLVCPVNTEFYVCRYVYFVDWPEALFEGSTTTRLQLLTSSVQDQPSSLHLSFLCLDRVIYFQKLYETFERHGTGTGAVGTKDMLFRISGVRASVERKKNCWDVPQITGGKCSEIVRWAGCLYSNILVGAFGHIYVFLPQKFLEDLYSDPFFASIGVETNSFYNSS